jgi:hypothetical protein
MNRRTTLALTTKALLCLTVATALPQMGFAQSNPLIGTWKLNLVKSKFSPGPAPRSLTIDIQAEGQGYKVNLEGIDAQGNPVKGGFGPYLLDGKPYPVTGNPDYDQSSYKRVSDSTWEITRIKGGKPVQTVTAVLSADGKTRTFTATGVNATGQQVNDVNVFDKQ